MAQKAALLGLGIENLALADYLLSKGAEITVCDRRTEQELGARLDELARKGAGLQLGPSCLSGLERFDVLYRSPGWPLFDPALRAAEAAGSRVTSAIRLFMEICPVPIIGVTGSKGKGTTASLIRQIMQREKQEKGGRVWLGGNIGVAPFSFYGEIGPNDLVVLEMSSFQLEDADRSPAVAVVTNITPEHLRPSDPNNPNYHRSFADYVRAKANILRHQGPGGIAVLNGENETCRSLAACAGGTVHWFGGAGAGEHGCFLEQRDGARAIVLRLPKAEATICAAGDVRVRGEHNLQNICAAAAAAAAVGASPDAIRDAVTSFEGLEHRLEFVREADGVKYFDDSFATTPEASAVALRAFREPIVLIAGGADKGSDYRPFAEAVLDAGVKAAILIGDTAAKIRRAIEDAAARSARPTPAFIEGLTEMSSIVARARSLAAPGDVVLLSTACASFGLFKNYKERGDLFKEAVRAL